MADIIALPPMTGWAPVLHQMIDSGDLAHMHASAAAVYLAIKRHADHQTGISEVSNKRLLLETGLSKPTFYKARQSLRDHGYLTFADNQHPAIYVVHEKIQYFSAERTPVACSTFRYVPALLHKLLETLRAQPLTQDLIGTTIQVGTINIQINVASGGPVDGEVL